MSPTIINADVSFDPNSLPIVTTSGSGTIYFPGEGGTWSYPQTIDTSVPGSIWVTPGVPSPLDSPVQYIGVLDPHDAEAVSKVRFDTPRQDGFYWVIFQAGVIEGVAFESGDMAMFMSGKLCRLTSSPIQASAIVVAAEAPKPLKVESLDF